jgi:hypothetical protein
MDKLVFSKASPPGQRVVVWPCTITRALDGGKNEKLLLDVKLQIADPEEISRAQSPLVLTGKDGNVVVYDIVVKGFPGLPGAEGMSDEELIAALRKDQEVVRGIAESYYGMVNGRVAGN